MVPQEFASERLDRVAPTCRPAGAGVMRQRWADLLFLHWTVPIAALQSLLPPGLTLDTYEGEAYVGLVPFTMTGVRPIWSPPVAPLSNFHEINVRTYVHSRGTDPGVWFFSLDAANALAVRIARAWYKLPYHFARMHMERQSREGIPTVRYRSERLWPDPLPAECTVQYTAVGPVTPAAVGTREHFLAERYILYSYAGGRLYSGRVHHTPYPLQKAKIEGLQENLVAAAGILRPDTPPLAHYASQVRVHVFPLRPVSK